MNVLITYLSFSGNTEEIAELLEERMNYEGYQVEKYDILADNWMPNVEEYDLILMGTFTWDLGSTPDEMKDFIIDVGYKPDNVAVFGSGDTQFGGDELYCRAVDKVATFYNSRWETLKVEQSPRGSQEKTIFEWVDKILGHKRSEAV